MSILNHTNFPALAFRQYNLQGSLNGVIVVRGAFKLVDDGPLKPIKEQPSLILSDTYSGRNPLEYP